MLSLPICQRTLRTLKSGSGNPRAWTSVPGRFPSFLLYIFTETRELQHLEAGTTCEPRSTDDLRRFESSVLGFLAVAFPVFFRKEVFQPHLPVRLPCYDLAPITSFTLDRSSQSSGTPGFHGLTGGVYKARERIHRAMADARLLANPASWSRVADSSPN